jgi:hypothetical protein
MATASAMLLLVGIPLLAAVGLHRASEVRRRARGQVGGLTRAVDVRHRVAKLQCQRQPGPRRSRAGTSEDSMSR